MIDYIGMLKEFHEKYRHDILISPGVPEIKTCKLRRRLIDEEVNIELLSTLEELEIEYIDHHIKEDTIIRFADAIADSLYVIFGTALSFGIPIDEVFAEVHRSNMTKDGPNSEHGKTLKGPSWEPPRIKEILQRHYVKLNEANKTAD